MDVLSAIRKRVGGDGFIVGFRYTADEAQKGGITPPTGSRSRAVWPQPGSSIS